MGLTAFRNTLKRYKVVGIDAMCFLYHFNEHPTFFPYTTELFKKLEERSITAVASTMTVLETMVHVERSHDPQSIFEYEQLIQNAPHVDYISIDWHVARLASKIRAKYPSIKSPDALHLSTAMLNNADVFITNDKQLAKQKEIPILLLDTE